MVLAVHPGAAAQLPLLPGSVPSASVAERCTPAVKATNGTTTAGQASTVTVSGLGTACAGKELALTLFDEDGAALAAGSTDLAADASGSATVAVPAYNPDDVAGVALTIGTWGVPGIWTYEPSIEAPMVSCTVLNDPTGTKTCDVTDVRVDAWGYPEPDNFNFYATVTSPSEAEDVEWELTLNLADPGYKLNANVADSNNGVTLAPGWSCSEMPLVKLRGQESVSTKYVGGGKTVTVWVQGKAASSPTSGGSLFNCS
ncbi:hypothetical protein [Arthrobacter luteolus]|uniref:hypothetical protein n=1 Tax=Arthrobacter luteolus TaxID=98672 RepID=UPI000829620E|nr:hypothetical protein [Arthrobacter luteolus]